MKNIARFIYCITLITISNFATAQSEKNDSTFSRYFIGSSAFMIGNFFPNPPDYYQLDCGYWLTRKDAIIISAKTWKYPAPLGIPYGSKLGAKEEEYPGYVRAIGIGVEYQRIFWKGLFLQVQVDPFYQTYNNPDKVKIQSGYQLWLVLRLGYNLSLFKDRFYLQPSIAFNYWPINTNLPESFAKMENKWNNFFLFEPGLNFGVKF